MLDLKKLKQLREKTGVSFAICKKALEETNNDIQQALKKLNEWSASKLEEKSQRVAQDGGIFSYIHHNRKVASLVEIRSETDFVSNNQEFIELGKEIAMQVASLKAKDVNELLEQEYIRDTSKKINDLLKEAVLKFGENIKIVRIQRWQLGE